MNGLLVRSNVCPITMSSITDATSNTILIAEKWLYPAQQGRDGGDNEVSCNAG
ncbi:MAG: DUF1559 domain-containing protein [Planctomycetota bacterium]|nr:MAG: DUF1559 domain-containing protein [Planctomycetota bacterium]